MLAWKKTLGVSWTNESEGKRRGQFVTRSHMLARSKWATLGRNKEKLIQDEEGKIWGIVCEWSAKTDAKGDYFAIDIHLTRW